MRYSRRVFTGHRPCYIDVQQDIMLSSFNSFNPPINSANQGVTFAPESAGVPCALLPASWSGSMLACLSLNAGWHVQHICISSHQGSSYQHAMGVKAHLCSVAGYKVEHRLTAHSGGLEALDARGNFVATCGYGTRLGQVALDNTVKVPFSPLACIFGGLPCTPGNTMHQSLLCCTNHMWVFHQRLCRTRCML